MQLYQCKNCKIVYLAGDLAKNYFMCSKCDSLHFDLGKFYECVQCGALHVISDENNLESCHICSSSLRFIDQDISLRCIKCKARINLKLILLSGQYFPLRCLNSKCNGAVIKKNLHKSIGPPDTIIDRPKGGIKSVGTPSVKNTNIIVPKGAFFKLLGDLGKSLATFEIHPDPYLYIGKAEIQSIFVDNQLEHRAEWFDSLKFVQIDADGRSLQEHFIIHRLPDDTFHLMDRNIPSATLLNNEPLTERLKRLQPGDIVTIPLIVNGVKIGKKLLFALE